MYTHVHTHHTHIHTCFRIRGAETKFVVVAAAAALVTYDGDDGGCGGGDDDEVLPALSMGSTYWVN